MKSLFLLLLSLLLLCTSFAHSSGSEEQPSKDSSNRREEGRRLPPYGEQGYYPYSYPYPYLYPPPPYLRYEESRKSPYDLPAVKQAGRLAIVVQPFDATVSVDGYQLKQKEDLTYELGLLTGLHRVEVIRKGYKPHSIEVVVEPGILLTLPIELEKEK